MEHMEDWDAMPTVVPSKAPPLRERKVRPGLGGTEPGAGAWRRLHDELSVVMAEAGQQVSAPPFQEVVEGPGGSLLHLDLVPVAPDLHAGQRHTHVQGPVELKGRRQLSFSSVVGVVKKRRGLCALTQST